jgi:hypothetical protein
MIESMVQQGIIHWSDEEQFKQIPRIQLHFTPEQQKTVEVLKVKVAREKAIHESSAGSSSAHAATAATASVSAFSPSIPCYSPYAFNDIPYEQLPAEHRNGLEAALAQYKQTYAEMNKLSEDAQLTSSMEAQVTWAAFQHAEAAAATGEALSVNDRLIHARARKYDANHGGIFQRVSQMQHAALIQHDQYIQQYGLPYLNKVAKWSGEQVKAAEAQAGAAEGQVQGQGEVEQLPVRVARAISRQSHMQIQRKLKSGKKSVGSESIIDAK